MTQHLPVVRTHNEESLDDSEGPQLFKKGQVLQRLYFNQALEFDDGQQDVGEERDEAHQ